MRLSELIDRERVIVPLPAATATDAARSLVERLIEAGAVEDPATLRSRVEEGRGEDVVAMGDRAFVMHYRTEAVRELAVALGTSPTPMRRAGDDGEAADAPGARIAVVIVAPRQLATRYLQVLGAVARALANTEVVDALLAAPDATSLAGLDVLATYELPEHLTVRDLMTVRPRTTSPDTPLRDAAAEIARAGIGALPVVGPDGLLVGMLSERELVRYLLSMSLQGAPGGRAAGRGNRRRLVRDVMTRQVLCVSSEQPLAEVASIMVNKDIDGVPVVQSGRVVGFLTRGDIIRNLIGS